MYMTIVSTYMIMHVSLYHAQFGEFIYNNTFFPMKKKLLEKEPNSRGL